MMPLLDRPATAPASPNRTRSGRRKASTSSSSTSPALAPGTLPGPVAPMPRRHRGATKQPDDIPPHLLVTAARTLFSKDPLLLTGDELAACASWVLQRRAQNTEYARRHRGKAKRKQEELEARAQALEEENRRLKARLGRNRRRWKEDGYATD
ncbi:hypothetical protein DFJ74DRAFT_676271 [Hyaloraphidium curvatum]|nr:hypothetical protein DFJ74DRAFT_676271 [Hyaloraphidium curvatum]